jgi:hypothetical protein
MDEEVEEDRGEMRERGGSRSEKYKKDVEKEVDRIRSKVCTVEVSFCSLCNRVIFASTDPGNSSLQRSPICPLHGARHKL